MPNTASITPNVVLCFTTIVILAMLVATSIVVGEVCLAHLGFKYLTDVLDYTKNCSWLIVTGAFFLQALVVFIILIRKIKRDDKIMTEEHSTLREVTSRFIKGFNSTD